MAQLRQSGMERVGGADQIGIRVLQKNGNGRIRRSGLRSGGQRRVSVFVISVILGLTLILSASVIHFFFFHDRELPEGSDYDEVRSDPRGKLKRSLAFKELGFGKGSSVVGGDSRFWERDDRRRDEEYDESSSDSSTEKKMEMEEKPTSDRSKGKARGMYNEAGRTELKEYEDMFQESLNSPKEPAEEDNQGEYDDGFEIEDEEHNNARGSPSKKGYKSGVGDSETASGNLKLPGSGKKSAGVKVNPKRRRYSGCEIKFSNSTDSLVEPVENRKFFRFSLQYTEVEERPSGLAGWEPRFSGHQTLQERENSFYARDQKLNCGFIKGPTGDSSTGFDLAEDDAKFMASCHIAVSSCIFGNSDRLRAPNSRTIKRSSRKHVCFVMFVDEVSLKTLSVEGQRPDAMGFYGLWKIVVVKNLPYSDMRRVGKIPKFLSHRLFPTARYSIWLDSKMRLTSDPQLLLEYFLWRKGYEYAISNHYDRHCVWDEVVQNKKLNKYNHTLIDRQFEFYQADGLTKFDPADPNKLLPSYVPEGSFILRAHTPMSNLFSCLWYNEVDRFTPRDQLSFAYTFLKLRRMNPDKPFRLNMFKDCERRAIAKLYHHRGEDKRAPLPKTD
ncbi:transmembrane protein (DUF616) [Wolffia australiana]